MRDTLMSAGQPAQNIDQAVAVAVGRSSLEESLRSSSSIDIDGDQFATIIGGRWDVRPPDTWRYRGFCWHWDAYAPGRIILAREEGFPYGISLSTLKAGMSDAGIILSGDVPLGITARFCGSIQCIRQYGGSRPISGRRLIRRSSRSPVAWGKPVRAICCVTSSAMKAA